MCAVEQRQPLLGAECNRLYANQPQSRSTVNAFASRGEGLALADQDECEMGQRSQVAAGTDRPTGRHDRRDAGVEQLDERFDDVDAHTRMATRQRRGEEQQHAAHHLHRQGLAHTDRMAAHDVDLQLGELIVGNAHRFERAEPRRDAIDSLALTGHAGDQRGSGGDASAGVLADGDLGLTARNRDNLGARQSATIEHDPRHRHADIIAQSPRSGRRHRRSAHAHRRGPAASQPPWPPHRSA